MGGLLFAASEIHSIQYEGSNIKSD